jgi:hypothetical protein
MTAVCECGFVAYNDAQNCVQWCEYARECVGDEMYEHLTGKIDKETEKIDQER